MASLLSLPPPLRRAGSADRPTTDRSPQWWAGTLAAARAAGLGLLVVGLVVILGWATAARSGAGTVAVLRAAGQVWLVGHHVPLGVPGGTLGLAPLGLAALPVTLLVLAGRWAARQARPVGLREHLAVAGSLALVYAAVAVLVAIAARTAEVRPHLVAAFLLALLLAALAGGYGVLAGSGKVAAAFARVPVLARVVLSGAVAGVAVLVAGGALLGAGSLLLHAGRTAELSRALQPGAVGGLLLAVLGAALVPNAAVWGASVALGPGFAVGEATSVTPLAADLGAVPALPLLGGLPDRGVFPPVVLLVGVVPLVAGVVVALVVLRRQPVGVEPVGRFRSAVHAGLGGVTAGALMAVLAVLAGGPLGGGRLSAVGPSPWQVGLAAALELGVVAAAAGFLGGRRAAG